MQAAGQSGGTTGGRQTLTRNPNPMTEMRSRRGHQTRVQAKSPKARLTRVIPECLVHLTINSDNARSSLGPCADNYRPQHVGPGLPEHDPLSTHNLDTK